MIEMMLCAIVYGISFVVYQFMNRKWKKQMKYITFQGGESNHKRIIWIWSLGLIMAIVELQSFNIWLFLCIPAVMFCFALLIHKTCGINEQGILCYHHFMSYEHVVACHTFTKKDVFIIRWKGHARSIDGHKHESNRITTFEMSFKQEDKEAVLALLKANITVQT